jgi:hypothetical protein
VKSNKVRTHDRAGGGDLQVRELATGREQRQEKDAAEQAAKGEHLAERKGHDTQFRERIRGAEPDTADDKTDDATTVGRRQSHGIANSGTAATIMGGAIPTVLGALRGHQTEPAGCPHAAAA